MTDSLVGVWGKLDRALAHRNELEQRVDRAFRSAGSRPHIGIKYEAETRESVLYVSKMKDFTALVQDCALITGDLLHNLRSALDHLAFQLAPPSTRNEERLARQIMFPICDNPSTFQAAKKRSLQKLRGHWGKLEKLQPYSSRRYDPNQALAILRDLNNRDKHQLLVPSVVIPKGYRLGVNLLTFDLLSSMSNRDRVAKSGGGALMFTLSLTPLEPNAELYRFTARPEQQSVEVKTVGRITPTVSFGYDRSAVALCTRLIEAITSTLTGLESYPARNSRR